MKYSSLADLKAVSRELKEKAKAAEEERRREEERRLAATKDARAFRAAMADLGVTPSKNANRVLHAARPKTPTPQAKAIAAQLADETPADRFSDECDPSDFLNEEDLFSRREGISPELPKRLRRGEWTVQAKLDLHGLYVDEARVVFAKFLDDCRIRGYRCLSIVHGKGYGSAGGQSVLREKVRRWVKQCDDVIAFAQAAPSKGDAGALIVLLKQSGTR